MTRSQHTHWNPDIFRTRAVSKNTKVWVSCSRQVFQSGPSSNVWKMSEWAPARIQQCKTHCETLKQVVGMTEDVLLTPQKISNVLSCPLLARPRLHPLPDFSRTLLFLWTRLTRTIRTQFSGHFSRAPLSKQLMITWRCVTGSQLPPLCFLPIYLGLQVFVLSWRFFTVFFCALNVRQTCASHDREEFQAFAQSSLRLWPFVAEAHRLRARQRAQPLQLRGCGGGS